MKFYLLQNIRIFSIFAVFVIVEAFLSARNFQETTYISGKPSKRLELHVPV